jgi:hypothetical protein
VRNLSFWRQPLALGGISDYAIVGAWTTYAAGTLEDAPNGLHIGVMSNGKFTPLRFPPGFDRAAQVATITW